MAAVEERISRIEGAYEHLATKADIAELRGEVRVLLIGVGSGLALLSIVLKFWPS